MTSAAAMPLGQLGLWRPAKYQWRLGEPVAVLPRDQRQHHVPRGAVVSGVAATHLQVSLEEEDFKSEGVCELQPEPEPAQHSSGPGLALLPTKVVPIGFRRCCVAARDHDSGNIIPEVVVTAKTGDLRRLCRALVRKGDRVIEIGCSTGFCTRVLVRSGPPELVVAVDTAFSCVAATEELVAPEREATGCKLEVLKLDALLDPFALSRLVARIQPSLAVVDVGGDRALPEVVAVIDELLRAATGTQSPSCDSEGGCKAAALPLDLIIVKSEQLAAAAEVHMDEQQSSDRDGGRCREAGAVDSSSFVPDAASWWRALPRGAALASTTAARTTCVNADRMVNRQPENQPKQRKKLRQPLKYPKRSVKEGAALICRFHNYDPVNGCKRYVAAQASSGDKTDPPEKHQLCFLDHEHCHFCLLPGHPAYACPGFLDASS